MKLSSPAKVNLFLHVSGRRPNGYHELVTLMSCIELHDVIALQPGGRGITVSCAHPEVPENETNLAHRAASLQSQKMLQTVQPVPERTAVILLSVWAAEAAMRRLCCSE